MCLICEVFWVAKVKLNVSIPRRNESRETNPFFFNDAKLIYRKTRDIPFIIFFIGNMPGPIFDMALNFTTIPPSSLSYWVFSSVSSLSLFFIFSRNDVRLYIRRWHLPHCPYILSVLKQCVRTRKEGTVFYVLPQPLSGRLYSSLKYEYMDASFVGVCAEHVAFITVCMYVMPAKLSEKCLRTKQLLKY